MLWLIGEDTTHAALVEGIVRGAVRRYALREGHAWLLEGEEIAGWALVWEGLEELEVVRPGLRYTSEVRAYRESTTVEIEPGRPIRPRGFIDGRPQELDAAKWRRILAWAFTQPQQREGERCVIIARDTDGDSGRLAGLRQVLGSTLGASRRWLVAAPHRDAECWFIAGWTPESEDERRAHQEVRGTLGFDPLSEPERLTSSPNTAPHDAKRVLARLRGLGSASKPVAVEELARLVERCLGRLEEAERRGEATGLGAFVREVEETVGRWVAGREALSASSSCMSCSVRSNPA